MTHIRLRQRRLLLTGVSVAAASLFSAPVLGANHWPRRPIRFIVPWAAGGYADFVARTVAEELSDILGQAVIVDNRPGAAGAIGTQYVAKGLSDGYTLLQGSSGPLILLPLRGQAMGYDADTDFTPIGLVTTPTFALVVRADLPVRTLAEFVTHARANPGMLNYGSAGIGTFPYLTMELLKRSARLDIKHVPYKGGSASVAAVVSGEVDATFDSINVVSPYIQSRRLRALTVAAAERSPLAPNLPTTAELGYPDAVVNGWNGLHVPAATPPEVVKRLSAALQVALARPSLLKKMTAAGQHVYKGTASEYAATVSTEKAKWREIRKSTDLLAE